MKFTKIKRAGLVVGSALLALSMTGTAHAGTQPSTGYVQTSPTTPGRGADGVADHIRAGGSDTTYDVMKALFGLYGGSLGCEIPNSGTFCSGTSPTNYITSEDYDHDTIDSEYPTGSGAGVSKLLGNLDLDNVAGNDVDPAFRVARSSAKRTEAGIFQSGFAKDGIAIIGFAANPNNPTTRLLSKENLKAIFAGTGPQAAPNDPNSGTCAVNWSQLINPITGTAFAAQPITAFGLQTASGTYGTFKTYLDGDDPNTCPNKVTGGGSNYFENNTAPVDGGVDTRGNSYATNPNRANAIWWGSFGVFSTDAVSAGTSKNYIIRKAGIADGTPLNPVNDQAPSFNSITAKKGTSNAYDIQRVLYSVFAKNDIDPGQAASGSGAGGAASMFRTWLCRQAGHATAPVNMGLAITDVIQRAGFIRLPPGEATQQTGTITLPNTERCENTLNP